MEEHSGVEWREWGEEAFAEARTQDRPVLLDIGAVWCHWCHVMDTGIPGDPVHTGTYSDPQVQQRIRDHFLPIKVDNDRRPDINARYNMGGWPTTVFLTPEGDTLYGETYVPPPRMVALLDYIADLWNNGRDQIIAQTAEVRAQRAQAGAGDAAASDLDPETVQTVLRHITRQFDPVYGGFGTQPKFPHPAALLLTLEQYARTGDTGLREVAEKTLAGMAGGGMYDQFAGGFFRYSTTRDWSIPHYEKMLEDNAKLTSVYAQASTALDDPRWLEVVKSAHGWLLSDMRDPETGAFAGSQDADKEEHYYGQSLTVRATLPTPYIDRTVYAGWNALMVSALVERYKVSGGAEVLDAAQWAWNFLDEEMQDEEGRSPEDVTLSHFYAKDNAQGKSGLLADQVPFIQACLDLYDVMGRASYLRRATQAMGFALGHLEDTENGGFYDLPPEANAIGELARPKKDIGENAEAALALLRLSALTDAPIYRQAAERALKVFVGEYANYGYHAAAYARAVDAALRPPLHIVIVGPEGHPGLWPLQQAAWQLAIPGKAVEWLTDGTERGYPAAPDGSPRAYVCLGTNCTVASTPQALVGVFRSGDARG